MHASTHRFLLTLATSLVLASPVHADPGDLVWSISLGDAIFSSAAIDPTRPRVYVGTQDADDLGNNLGALVAVDYGSGNPFELWRLPVGDWIDSSPTLSDSGVLYFGSWDQNLYAADAETGAALWSFPTGGIIVASPALSGAGEIIIPSTDSFLYAFAPDGSLLWESFVGSEMDSSPAIGDDGTIYVGNYAGELVALNPDGSEKWRFAVDTVSGLDSRILGSPALTPEGKILFGSGNGRFYSLNPDGSLNWSTAFPEEMDSSPAIDEFGDIYSGSRAGAFFKLNELGVESWSLDVGDVFFSSPVLDALGNAYIVAYDGDGQSRVYAVDPEGQVLWTQLIPAIVDASPTLTPDGLLVVGAYDGVLYAFEAGLPLNDLYWPKFGYGLRNHGDLGQSPVAAGIHRWFGYPVDLGDQWYFAEHFEFLFAGALPWTYWADWAWLFPGGPGADSQWLYHPQLGWIWTSPDAFPYLYQNNSGDWLYLHRVAGEAPWYYRFGNSPGWFQ